MIRDTICQSAMMAATLERYHAWPTIRKQTNAEHSYNVLRLYIQIWGDPSPEVTRYIVIHDLGEWVSGDAPFPVKQLHPALKAAHDEIESEAVVAMGFKWPDLDKVEQIKIKLCDLLEMTEFALLERRLGNSLALPVEEDTSEMFFILLDRLPDEVQKPALEYWADNVTPWAMAFTNEEKEERGLG